MVARAPLGAARLDRDDRVPHDLQQSLHLLVEVHARHADRRLPLAGAEAVLGVVDFHHDPVDAVTHRLLPEVVLEGRAHQGAQLLLTSQEPRELGVTLEVAHCGDGVDGDVVGVFHGDLLEPGDVDQHHTNGPAQVHVEGEVGRDGGAAHLLILFVFLRRGRAFFVVLGGGHVASLVRGVWIDRTFPKASVGQRGIAQTHKLVSEIGDTNMLKIKPPRLLEAVVVFYYLATTNFTARARGRKVKEKRIESFVLHSMFTLT